MIHSVRSVAVMATLVIACAARAAEPAPAAPTPVPPAAVAPSKPPVKDHLDLDPTQITGNRELPKVMVVVPWKHAGAAAPTGRPAASLVDEILKPADREVLRRELAYFGQTLKPAPVQPPVGKVEN